MSCSLFHSRDTGSPTHLQKEVFLAPPSKCLSSQSAPLVSQPWSRVMTYGGTPLECEPAACHPQSSLTGSSERLRRCRAPEACGRPWGSTLFHGLGTGRVAFGRPA